MVLDITYSRTLAAQTTERATRVEIGRICVVRASTEPK